MVQLRECRPVPVQDDALRESLVCLVAVDGGVRLRMKVIIDPDESRATVVAIVDGRRIDGHVM